MALVAILILLLAAAGTADLPVLCNGLLQADNYPRSGMPIPAPAILSIAGSIITMAEKTKPGPAYEDWRLALATTKIVIDLINTAFKHEDGGSSEISQKVAEAYYDASISCKRMVRKLYSAAVTAETEMDLLLAVQESLKRNPNHGPALRELQAIISTGLTMPTSIEKDLEDVLSAYMHVIKLCQNNAIAKERKEVFIKMSGALTVGMVSGAAGVYYALFSQVYSIALGATFVTSAASFSKAVELQRSFAILEDRMNFLKETRDEAGRQYSSVSDIQLLFQMLQSRIQGVTQTTALDSRLQEGMRMFLSPDMNYRLRMYSLDLLQLQEDCLQLRHSMSKVLNMY